MRSCCSGRALHVDRRDRLRVHHPDSQIVGDWAREYGLGETEVGKINGVGLWPFAISIVLFSLIIDKIGYGKAMAFAFLCHVSSAILTILVRRC